MEELNNEIVELDNNDVIVETPNEETGMSGALVAGAIGGLFAVAVVSGGKKLAGFARAKWSDHRAKRKGKKDEEEVEEDLEE